MSTTIQQIKALLASFQPPEALAGWEIADVVVAEGRFTVQLTRSDPRGELSQVEVYATLSSGGAEPALERTKRFDISYRSDPAWQEQIDVPVELTRAVARCVAQGEDALPPDLRLNSEMVLRTDLYEIGEIRINRRCNEACPFCNSRGEMENYDEDPARISERIRELRDAGATRLTITGMEPTLDANLVRFISEARELGFEQVLLQTNGVRLADKARARELIAAGLDLVTLSCHAADPRIGARVTGYADDVRDTWAALDNLIELDVPLEINVVVTRWNLDEAVEIIRRLSERVYRDRFLPARRAVFEGFDAAFAPDATPFRLHMIPWSDTIESEKGGIPLVVLFSVVAPTFDPLGDRAALVPSYREVIPVLTAALDEARRLLVPVKITGRCGVPLCLLGEHRRFAVNWSLKSRVETPETHVKPSTCAGCSLGQWCEGVWQGYAELYGVSEVVLARRNL